MRRCLCRELREKLSRLHLFFGSPAQKRGGPAQKRPARANRTQIESCRSLTRTQSPRLIKQILRIQNKISYAYELLRNGWAQRTISRALQECHYFVPRHVSRKALNYMHTKYLNISKLTSEKFGKYRPLFLYIGRCSDVHVVCTCRNDHLIQIIALI